MGARLFASVLASPYANAYDLSVFILTAWLTLHDYSISLRIGFYLAAAWVALLFVRVTSWPEVLAAIVDLVVLLVWHTDRPRG